jgi:hypothetical protein
VSYDVFGFDYLSLLNDISTYEDVFGIGLVNLSLLNDISTYETI